MIRPRLIHALAALLASGGAHAVALLDVAPESSVEVPAFRYAADKAFRASLTLQRIEVYAPEARVYVARGHGLEEIPRSDLRLFVGAPGEPQRLYLAVSADGRRFDGAVFDGDGATAIAGRVEADGLVVDKSTQVGAQGNHFECGGSPEPAVDAFAKLADALREGDPALARAKGNPTRQGVVAVDTDNELLLQKFADNTTLANNYIATLFAGMNVFFERDLALRLTLGTVILRPSGTPDPYPSTSATAIDVQLSEFGEHWRTNPALSAANVPRAWVAMLSGKSGNQFSASGIAWRLNSGNYCTLTGTVQGNGQTAGHYNLTRVFKFAGATAADDVSIVGHEIGHNLGAAHTHCSSATTGDGNVASNTIDRCFNGESGLGCYGGAVSCPTDNSISGRGSVMSYCNFGPSAGANCGDVLNEFHPAHQLYLGGRISSNVSNGCLAAISGDVGPQVAAASPASGSTTPLGGGFVGNRVSGSITFSVSGGSGNGTTQLTCSVGSGTVSIASGTPQTIPVNGSAQPVGVRFTLTGGSQSGVVNCSAVRQGGATSNFSYTFTASAGTAQPANRVHCSGFEINEVVGCTQ